MKAPTESSDRPVGGTGRSGADSGKPDSPEILYPLAELVMELRPDIPPSIAESLVREALDKAAVAVLDAEWAEARERLYPEAIATARGLRKERKAREVREQQRATARLYRPATFVKRDGVMVYRSADFHGRVACRCSRCTPLDFEAVA